MSAGTLYTIPIQSKGNRIRAIAAFGGVDIKVADGYEHGVTNKSAEYKAKFASGKIPAFETPSGFRLFESVAIAQYVASLAPNSTLLGSSPEDAAIINQWVSFGESEIFTPMSFARGLCSGNIPYSKPIDIYLRERVVNSINVLESSLISRTYLVTERITLADITLATILKPCFETLIDAPLRQQIPNTIRYFNTVANHPLIAPILGETAFVEKAIQFTPPAKEKKEKEKAPKEAAAPKEKPAKAAKEADDDDDEPLVPEEPKVKNPLDDLPKSNFNLEEWKRAYSNMETRGPGGAIEWFYQKFDKEGFSIWRVDFKYNEELTLVFKSSNQITGFFNRLEASRKYLFGSVGVLGEPNNSVISGVFILRGSDFKPVLEAAPDWESYDYAPIDLENAESKAFFEAALAWDLEIDGKKWADGKNFK